MQIARPSTTQPNATNAGPRFANNDPVRVDKPMLRNSSVLTPNATYSQNEPIATRTGGGLYRRSAAPVARPAVTAAITPETWTDSASAYDASARALDAMIAVSGSSAQRITSPAT